MSAATDPETFDTISLVRETVLAGRFRIVSRIHQSPQGSTYLAEQQPLGRKVEVKLLEGVAPAVRAQLERRSFREAEALARVTDPHVQHLFDYGVEAGRSYLVLEHLAGETLAQTVRRAPLTLAQAVEVGRQVCLALEASHYAGVLHRNVKPSSVVLLPQADGAMLVKLRDFGLAQVSTSDEEQTITGKLDVDGTFAAPEVLLGAQGDARTDVYGAALLVFFAATGGHPFFGRGLELVRNKQAGKLADLSALRGVGAPPALVRILSEALHPDPDQRPESAHALHALLDETAGKPQRSNASLATISIDKQRPVTATPPAAPAASRQTLRLALLLAPPALLFAMLAALLVGFAFMRLGGA